MDICYPPDTDWSCKFTPEQLEEMRGNPVELAKLERAEAFAWSTLAALTAYQIGTCPITVRPCAARCAPSGSYTTAVVGGGSTFPVATIGRMFPVLAGGVWYNVCGCGSSDDCSCATLSEVILPGPVGKIVSVKIDGVELAASDYRVDNSGRLVRQDGEAWPGCQDLSVAAGEPGTFEVTYYRGAAPNALTRAAAGALAAEFLAGCNGQECRLPWNLVSVARQGENYEFGEGGLEGVASSIPEVTAIVNIYNPYGLKSRPRISSPDSKRTRVTTWRI